MPAPITPTPTTSNLASPQRPDRSPIEIVDGLFEGGQDLLKRLPRATKLWQPRRDTRSAEQFCIDHGADGTSPNHRVPEMGAEGRYLWCL